MIIQIHKPTKIKYKNLKYYVVVFLAFCLSLMFHVEMSDNMDFVRHQTLLNIIRESKIGFWDYVVHSQFAWTENKTYSFTFCFNALCYIIAKLFENNYVLVWVSALMEYGIIAYIAYDWKKDSKYTNIQIICSIAFCYAVYPMIHAFSGLRTSIAASFMALAIYMFLYKNCSIIKFAVLCFISVTFHPVMFFAIPICVVIKISPKLITIIITIVGTLMISRIAAFLEQTNIVFFNAIAVKYFTYTSENQFRAWRFCLYGVILICIICIIFYLFIRGNENDKSKDKLYAFLICYMSLILGNIGGYELVMRSSYLMGALAPIIISMLTERQKLGRIQSFLGKGAIILVFALSIYMGIMYIYYMGSFFFDIYYIF